MRLDVKIGAAIAAIALIGGGAYLLTTVEAAHASVELIRAMHTTWVIAAVLAAALMIYLVAVLATDSKRRRGQAQEYTPAQGDSAYAPDALDRRPVKPSRFGLNMALTFVVVLFIVATIGTGMDIRAIINLPMDLWFYGGLMAEGVFQIPDEDARDQWGSAFSAMVDSLSIAWIGTLIGAVFSLPCGFLAARNMTPLAIYIPMRFILSVIRAVPEIVFAVAVFIALFSLVSYPELIGAFALGISSVGTLSKLISEAIENVDNGPLEAARASGASSIQMIRWAVLPQVLPEVLAIWLYRFEVNIRAGAILGAVGAGGVGSELRQVLQQQRDWAATGITLVVIILVTIAVDQLSAFVRHRVIHGKTVRQKKRKKDDGTGGAPGSEGSPAPDSPDEDGLDLTQARAETTVSR